MELKWFKSSRSGGGQHCVETAFTDGGAVYVRDSKNPDGPALRFTREEWAAFIGGVHDGEFEPR